jgi:hypothetical protein
MPFNNKDPRKKRSRVSNSTNEKYGNQKKFLGRKVDLALVLRFQKVGRILLAKEGDHAI